VKGSVKDFKHYYQTKTTIMKQLILAIALITMLFCHC